jgi:hypothetical protein
MVSETGRQGWQPAKRPPVIAHCGAGRVAAVLARQGAIGNRAVRRLLRQQSAAAHRRHELRSPARERDLVLTSGYGLAREPQQPSGTPAPARGPTRTPARQPPPPTPIPAPDAVDITVIDRSDLTGKVASATTLGEVYMTNIDTMVKAVLDEAGDRPIGRLNIVDHANESGMQIGEERVNERTIDDPDYYRPLSKLKDKLTRGRGFVHVQGCDIGNNSALILKLAKVFGVPVFAGTGRYNPVYGIQYGRYVRADPPPNARFYDPVPAP